MTPAVDMRVRIGALEMRNPVMTASGTFGSGREYADFIDLARLGALVTKGVSLHPWSGNDGPRIAETPSGMLNSIGLQNPGVEAFAANDLVWLATQDVPVVVNVSGHTVEEYAAVAERLDAEPVVSALEVNISCPNVDEGGMVFGTSCPAAAQVTRAVRAVTGKTLIVKLSPNVTDIAEIARAVEAEGADAVSLINTLLGMAIDTNTFRPRLARGVGGLSGPGARLFGLAETAAQVRDDPLDMSQVIRCGGFPASRVVETRPRRLDRLRKDVVAAREEHLLPAPELLAQLAVTPGPAGLPLQGGALLLQFVHDVVDAREVLLRGLELQLGRPAA